MIRAFIDGLRRVGRAPWLLLGVGLWTLASAATDMSGWGLLGILADSRAEPGRIDPWLERLLSVPSGLSHFVPVSPTDSWRFPDPSLTPGIMWFPLISVLPIILLMFLQGGIFDRLARDRRVGAAGFFGACGGYTGRVARLWIAAGLLYWPVDAYAPQWLAMTLFVALNIVVDYATIRMVVEDRRSALGSLVAALRFVARHPAPVLGLYALNALTFMAATVPLGSVTGQAEAVTLALLVITAVMHLLFGASQIALFQSRLAHAGYTARPVPKWPDSPAAEAIRLMD